MKCYKCQNEIHKNESLFQGSFLSEEIEEKMRTNHKSPIYNFCLNCISILTNKFHYQPERSKREDACQHEWGSENRSDSDNPTFTCNKCDAVL